MGMLKKMSIARAKKHLLGKVLCRLFGDEKGAVMMEYVIVAVLIAAACVVAVAMFGRTIVGMFSVAAGDSFYYDWRHYSFLSSPAVGGNACRRDFAGSSFCNRYHLLLHECRVGF